MKGANGQTAFDSHDMEAVYRQGNECLRAATIGWTPDPVISRMVGHTFKFLSDKGLEDILGAEWLKELDKQRAEGE